ncbi:hypothetical protein ACFOHS_22910 [Jhaorihella thermophila]
MTCLRIGNVAGADAILGDWRPGFRLDRFADGRTPPAQLCRPRNAGARAEGSCRRLRSAAGSERRRPPARSRWGALLDAAGLAWTPRPAPEDAIARVQLDVSALERFTSFAPRDSLPRTMVAEWRELACLETYIS